MRFLSSRNVLVGNSSIHHETLSLPIEERLILVKDYFCDMGPRVSLEVIFPEISFWGLRDLAQMNKCWFADDDFAEEGLNIIDWGGVSTEVEKMFLVWDLELFKH